MGKFKHTVERKELKPGDHIYTWRKFKIYAHHGIYKDNDIVIHFRGKQRKEESPPISSALISYPPPNCKKCREYRKREMGDSEKAVEKVSITCLDCFLAGGKLKRARYSVKELEVKLKRPMTCFTATADTPEKVLERATLLLKNGFGPYNVAFNNCEDFAFYCTTGNNCPQERVEKICIATDAAAVVISGASKAAAVVISGTGKAAAVVIRGTGEAAAVVISGAGKAVAKACNEVRSNYKGKGPM